MRKWTYLVAALLMSGTAATFTSCIDNEEPAGIEAMRTAKAEFYSAQAALKLAEVEFENARTQLKLQQVEKEKYMNEALRLQNELQAAKDENEKKKLALALAEAEKQHEIAMQVYETTLKQAEAAYQVALKDFDLAMANINSAYTAEYARILASITSNRAEYKKIAADITDKELTLMQFAEETLDTASVRGKLVRNVDKLTAELQLMEDELELLTTINNADAEEQNKIIADLDKEIREKVEDYNADVAKYNKLKTDLTNALTAASEKANALNAENVTKFEVDAEATLTVAPEIQHEFISFALDPSNNIIDQTFIQNNVNTELIDGNNYYIFKATDNLFKLKYTKNDLDDESTATSNPTYELSNDISTISTYLSSFSENDYQEKVAKKQLYNDILDSYKTKYEKQLEEFEKEGGTRDIYLEKLAAYTMYKQGSDKDVYYNYIKDYKTDVYDAAIEAANQLTDATARAAAIKAAQDAFIAELKAYGKARFELNGWFFADPDDDTKKFYETIESAEVDTYWSNILGSETLEKGIEGSPYYNFLTEGKKLFGKKDGFGSNYLTNGEAYTKPDINTEYKKYLINPDNQYKGGMFADYLQAYINEKAVAIAVAKKALVDQIEKINASLTVKKLEFAVLVEEVLENAEYLALVENEKNIQKQIDDLEVQIGEFSEEEEKPSSINVKLNYSNVDNDNDNAGDDSGEGEDAAVGSRTVDRITTITLVDNDGEPVTPEGYKGDYLVSLTNYHNELRSGVTGYEEQLADLQEKYDAKEAEKVSAEQLLAEFDKGGYEIYDEEEVEDGDPGETTKVDYKIKIGGKYDGYITYTLVPDESGETTTIVETTSYLDPELNQWVDYEKTTTIPSSELGYIAGIVTGNDDEPTMSGSANNFKVTTHFLKVIIEAYNAEIEILKAQLLDLDAEHEILKKELAAFLEVLNERYPEAAAQ